ncbi:DUF4437 domain-containing protein [Gayadomonas joobiniege]|uniref:DUF4437 domain-containing protein n=1 Tax=Gayadomonas joobiniege TaxID=1234606 RepID=UPI00035E8655|nr:DUF4437 domain-containing protein [Gayadomonas joobiniege]
MKSILKVSLLSLTLSSIPSWAADSYTKVIATKDIQWGYLNPLRGDKSPGAADLWGDRTKDTATGMLVRFKKGFESPPHIHNISYRGVVIQGLMHNDDPTAGKMWMPTGSFWTQPAGENHTTAANDQENLIYLEIDQGPYLVQPSKKAFDNGERPLNLHRDNIVWLNNSDLYDIKKDGVKAAYLWGQTGQVGGTLIKVPSGFEGFIITDANEFRAVVIEGELTYQGKKTTQLAAGSYLESSGQQQHKLINSNEAEAIIYLRTDKKFIIQ